MGILDCDFDGMGLGLLDGSSNKSNLPAPYNVHRNCKRSPSQQSSVIDCSFAAKKSVANHFLRPILSARFLVTAANFSGLAHFPA